MTGKMNKTCTARCKVRKGHFTIFLPEMTTHSFGPQVWMLPMVAVWMWTLTAGLQWKLMIHFHTVTGNWALNGTELCTALATIARYPVTWCDGLIWWRHTGSLQCSGSPNTNKDTFLSRSCVYLELYFIISLNIQISTVYCLLIYI